MLKENPTIEMRDPGSPYCAIRKRKPDGSPRTGSPWYEPMGSVTSFLQNQTEWEVVFYNTGDKLPL